MGKRLFSLLSLLALLTMSLVGLAQSAPVAHAASSAPLLPGESLWGGVPSYLFGLGDTYNYLPGFDSNSSIQGQVKSAGVPLIRVWFDPVNEQDHTTRITDAQQLAIAQTVQNAGARCIGNLTQESDLSTPAKMQQQIQDDLHLVSLLKGKCDLYEVMNEPDLGAGNWPPAVTEANYISFWDTFVPQARAIDPNALFGGPTLATEFGLDDPNFMQNTLKDMSSGGVWPDFVTYHFYVCSGDSQANCLNDASTYTPGHGKTVAGWIAQDFPGKSVPMGITEWNADPGNPPWGYNDAFMAQFEQTALAGWEQNPYVSFLTQFNIAAYAGYGTLDMFRLSNPEASGLDYTNTPTAIGSPRPMFSAFAQELARVRGGGTSTPPPPPPSPTPSSSGVPSYDHVITIVEENHSYSDVVGSASAPYINNTLIPSGALATNYNANVQSSLPNYLALFGGDTLGLTSNCEPSAGCQSSGPTIASEAEAAGKTWKVYEQSMTANCQNVVDGGTGNVYTVHHNPAPFYTSLKDCGTRDVPYSQLSGDLQSGLPNYVMVVPDLNNDMHNGTIQAGDTFLSSLVPSIQQSPVCQSSRCLIAVTFDEGSYDASGAPMSPHVMTVLVGPDVKAGTKDATSYNHYNLLHTTEVALGLGTLTSHDAGAQTMDGMFGASSVTPPPPTPTPDPTQPPSPTPTPTQTPPPPTSGSLFNDDFSSGSLGSAWHVEQGTWAVSGGALKQTGNTNGNAYISVAPGGDWTDQTLSADMMPDPNHLGGTFNLMARYTDANNHVSFILKNGSEWWLGQKVNGNWQTLDYGTFSYAGQFYHIKLSVQGDTVSAFLNGNPMGSGKTALAHGGIGFAANAAGELDNVSVDGVGTPVGSTPPPPPPPSPVTVNISGASCTVKLPDGTSVSGTCSGSVTYQP